MGMRALVTVMMMLHGRWRMVVFCRGGKRGRGQRVRGTETAGRRWRFTLVVCTICGGWARGMNRMIVASWAFDIRVSMCDMRVGMVRLVMLLLVLLLVLLLLLVIGKLEGIAHLWTGRTRRTRAGNRGRVANGVGEAAMCIPIVIGARERGWGRTGGPIALDRITVCIQRMAHGRLLDGTGQGRAKWRGTSQRVGVERLELGWRDEHVRRMARSCRAFMTCPVELVRRGRRARVEHRLGGICTPWIDDEMGAVVLLKIVLS